MEPAVSVLIATRNRAHTFPDALEAFCALEEPPGGWELVVVDNASTDDTQAVLEPFAARIPLTVLHEPRPGKSFALNSGLEHVRGGLVVFSDDDIFPRPDWLRQLVRVAQEQPSPAVFGGAILPRWPDGTPPAWVLEWVPVGTAFAMTDPALVDGPILPYLVFGGNMAVRRAVFEAGHRFDTLLGPGQRTAMGDEAEFVTRVSRAGYETWYTSAAVVEHLVRREQLGREWLVHRAYRAGRAEFRQVMQAEAVPDRLVLGVPPWLLKAYGRTVVRRVLALVSGSPERRFRSAWDEAFLRGEVLESRLLYGSPDPGGEAC